MWLCRTRFEIRGGLAEESGDENRHVTLLFCFFVLRPSTR